MGLWNSLQAWGVLHLHWQVPINLSQLYWITVVFLAIFNPGTIQGCYRHISGRMLWQLTGEHWATILSRGCLKTCELYGINQIILVMTEFCLKAKLGSPKEHAVEGCAQHGRAHWNSCHDSQVMTMIVPLVCLFGSMYLMLHSADPWITQNS